LFKKTENVLVDVNPKCQRGEKPLKIRLEMDEMWGRVCSKKTPYWLWHAINHENGDVVAFALGVRKSDMLHDLLRRLETANIKIAAVFADDNFAYRDIIAPDNLLTGKRNTQKIERKHLTFKTRLKRLARKTICYSDFGNAQNHGELVDKSSRIRVSTILMHNRKSRQFYRAAFNIPQRVNAVFHLKHATIFSYIPVSNRVSMFSPFA
jgi:insertion element IS1 protein InsB